MSNLLLRIEHSGLAEWIRSTDSIFGYYGLLTMHAIGMGIVVGISAGFDLRILGFARGLPLAAMEKFLPYLWIGFAINAISGTLLLATDATHKLVNPDFYVKMVCIALGLGALQLLTRDLVRAPAVDTVERSTKTKVIAAVSLACWLGAIVAGRLLAYVGAGGDVR